MTRRKTISERVAKALTKAEQAAKISGTRLRAEVEAAMIDLCEEIQDEAEGLVVRAKESVERAVSNSYEDCKALCMEMRPPARDVAEAITRRQREVLGLAEDTAPEEHQPLDPGLWGDG